MKTIALTLFTFLTLGGFATNRIATLYDQGIYGSYIKAGDLIIDTPTKITENSRELIYYFMEKEWPNLKEGATIWLDGDKLGFLTTIKFCNTAPPLTPWHIQSAKFRNIPHTQVRATSFTCQGLKHFEMDGESRTYSGLSSWPSTRKFLTGSFGFHFINEMFSVLGIAITVLDEGTINMKGFEVQHGFCGVRINGGDYDMTVESVRISNFYIHDTGDGEAFYLGATHAPPFAKLKNLKIYNGVITRIAAEALQFQHMIGGADIHHITIRNADVRWTNAFQPGQDTGIQWSVDEGENKLHHIILDGYASVGLIPFGSEQKHGGVSKVSNVLFNDGIDIGIFLHNSGVHGVKWIFDSLYFRGFNDYDYKNTGRPKKDYIISAKYGTDDYVFPHIFHDGSKKSVFENTNGLEIGDVLQRNLPGPLYRNSGFYEPANRVRHWSRYYGGYFPASQAGTVNIPIEWKAGDIAIETEGTYAFYKCVSAPQTASVPSPSQNPDFVKLTWDARGLRSDQRGWDRNSKQSNFPPDDLRLKKRSYWQRLGFGFYH